MTTCRVFYLSDCPDKTEIRCEFSTTLIKQHSNRTDPVVFLKALQYSTTSRLCAPSGFSRPGTWRLRFWSFGQIERGCVFMCMFAFVRV